MVHHTSSKNHPLQVVFFLLLFGGHLLYTAIRRWRRSLVVQDTPIVPIAAAPQGLVEVQGYAWPKNSILAAPVDGNPCLFFSVKLQHYQSNGKSGSWITVFSLTTNDPFYIVDHSGAVQLVPDPGECSLNPATHYVSKMSDSQKQRIFNLAGKDQPHWYSGNYRVIEEVIQVGSPFYALGDFVTHAAENHVDISYAGAGQFINKMNGATHTSLLEFQKIDTNHDGVISESEWASFCVKTAGDILSAGGHGAAQALGHATAVGQSTAFGGFGNSTVSGSANGTHAANGIIPDPKCLGTLQTTQDRKVYFADCHKEALEKRLRSGFYWKILLGAALFAGGITFLAYLIFEHQM